MIDFKALQKPFAKQAVKIKTTKYKDKKTGAQKQFSVSYITSRQVMNRLDEVCGPANWRDEYVPTTSGLFCTIYILCDGEWVGKTDVGVESDIAPEQGAAANAFKRAAVKWGIGRELYDDGIADLDGTGGEVAPQSELDDIFWTRTSVAANAVIDYARKVWDGQIKHQAHGINRLAAALGLSNCNGNKAKFADALAAEYTGSFEDACDAVDTYESESE
jgi:hypothetical protein